MQSIDVHLQLDVVFEHVHNHFKQVKTEIIFEDHKLIQVLHKILQLGVWHFQEIKGASPLVVLELLITEAGLLYNFPVVVQRLHHFFNIVWTPIHVLEGQESFPFDKQTVVHFLGGRDVVTSGLRHRILLLDREAFLFILQLPLVDISSEGVIGFNERLSLWLFGVSCHELLCDVLLLLLNPIEFALSTLNF